jgi:hypothetical protein
MELHYQNLREDVQSYYQVLWRDRKAASRSDFYYGVVWYLAVIGLGIFVAARHEDIFAVCVFAILALSWFRQNWSFEKYWTANAASYADSMPECSVTLRVDDTGVTEQFSNVELRVPWSEIHEYNLEPEGIYVHFLKYRAFIIPVRDLASGQRDELIKMLENHNVRKKT